MKAAPAHSRKRARWAGALFVLALAAWLGGVVAGFGRLLDHQMTTGRSDETPVTWPSGCGVERVAGAPSLLMFVHPLCPCSRASMTELGLLLTRAPALNATVLVLFHEGASAEWDDRSLADLAASVPGARVVSDVGGAEARRFGARTSGHVVVYDGAGRLSFSGGITGSRGHVGDNPGLSRALAASITPESSPTCSPVFGCCLREPE